MYYEKSKLNRTVSQLQISDEWCGASAFRITHECILDMSDISFFVDNDSIQNIGNKISQHVLFIKLMF